VSSAACSSETRKEKAGNIWIGGINIVKKVLDVPEISVHADNSEFGVLGD